MYHFTPVIVFSPSLQFSYGKLVDIDSTDSESIYFIIKVSRETDYYQKIQLPIKF